MPEDIQQALEAVQAEYSAHSREQPPDLLDQAVLNRARRELEQPKSRPVLRWLTAVASASVVVLSLAVVMEQITRGPHSNAPDPAKVNTLPKVRTMSENDLRQIEDDALIAEEIGHLNLPESPQRSIHSSEIILPQEQESMAAPAATPPAAAAARLDSADSPEPDINRLPTRPAEEPEQEFPDEVQASGSRLRKEDLEQSRPAIEPDADTMLAEPIDEGVAAETEDPEEWLRSILRWHRIHQHNRVRRELDEFRKAHPDYELPAELENL